MKEEKICETCLYRDIKGVAGIVNGVPCDECIRKDSKYGDGLYWKRPRLRTRIYRAIERFVRRAELPNMIRRANGEE